MGRQDAACASRSAPVTSATQLRCPDRLSSTRDANAGGARNHIPEVEQGQPDGAADCGEPTPPPAGRKRTGGDEGVGTGADVKRGASGVPISGPGRLAWGPGGDAGELGAAAERGARRSHPRSARSPCRTGRARQRGGDTGQSPWKGSVAPVSGASRRRPRGCRPPPAVCAGLHVGSGSCQHPATRCFQQGQLVSPWLHRPGPRVAYTPGARPRPNLPTEHWPHGVGRGTMRVVQERGRLRPVRLAPGRRVGRRRVHSRPFSMTPFTDVTHSSLDAHRDLLPLDTRSQRHHPCRAAEGMGCASPRSYSS